MGRKNKNKRNKKATRNAAAVDDDKPPSRRTSPRSVLEETTPTAEPPTIHDEKIVVIPPPPASKTRLALAEGRKDLKNAQPPLEFLLNPIRRALLDPSMALASIVVPGIVTALPFADDMAATCLQLPCNVAKFAYGLLPFRGDSQTVNLARIAQNDLLSVTSAGSNPLILPENIFQASIGFAFSAVVDAVGAMWNPTKATTWIVSLWQLLRFLDSSQLINVNLKSALVESFYSGRLVDNVNIYQRIQKSWEERIHSVQHFRQAQIQPWIKQGAHFMKYATAAYGTGMISASLQDREISTTELDRVKTAIAKHVGIRKNDIVQMCVSEGGNVLLLRHFIAIDRASRNVVLAIRGTLSVSGALIDLQAQDAEFCTGKAHKGMSEMAVNLWNASGTKIRETLSQLEAHGQQKQQQPWGLVLVGHSVGAGTAALLNIKCHVEGLLGPNRTVKCFGFASPPVFSLDGERHFLSTKSLDKAIKNCTCFIHGEDCVPFLSISSVSRFATQLERIDNATKRMWPLDRMSLASGKTGVPQDLVQEVQHAEQPVVSGASRLAIPAEKIVWTYANENGGFDAMGCHSDDVANLGVFVSEKMTADHFPNGYQDSLGALAK